MPSFEDPKLLGVEIVREDDDDEELWNARCGVGGGIDGQAVVPPLVVVAILSLCLSSFCRRYLIRMEYFRAKAFL